MDYSEVIIIQPPLVQLNTPYPSGAYLSAFFKSQLSEGTPVIWHDLSIALFHRIFSRQGLTELFDATSARALGLAVQAEKKGDINTSFQLEYYVSSAPLWINWIDDIVDMLCTGNRERAHEFVRSAHAPRGNRMDRYLEAIGRDVSVDDVRMLASLALADLADYINVVFDGNFSLIRYAESLSASTATFAEIAAAADSPVMRAFYVPLLREVLGEHTLSGADAQEGMDMLIRPAPAAGKKLFLVTVPFAGCFAAALATCREIKACFGDSAVVCMGGGYVNTALRGTHESALSEYIDFLSFDRGYAFYLELLRAGPDALKADAALSDDTPSKAEASQKVGSSLLKADTAKEGRCTISRQGAAAFQTSEFQSGSNLHVRQDAAIGSARAFSGGLVRDIIPGEASFALEESLTRTLIPDYSDIDFSLYPRVADDVNPMHRIWSDGAWLKAYLAHGCYWHRCAFCDTQLDYVCNYKRVGAAELHEGLSRQAEEKGVYGVHFVDEAAPPAALKEFALANISSARRRLSFWGNIRFEKAFTRDMADFLAYGGLIGVSGGIEIASKEGLADINKGIDIDSLVGSCAAFKEAGVLVHAYMIYGFYNETPQMLIDSMEMLRQLFFAGLIDSAFWHKFTLTRHSTVYAEWQAGKRLELRPLNADEAAVEGARTEKALFAVGANGSEKAPSANKASSASKAPRAFADYELHFAGEENSEKYGAPLLAALDAWMHGHDLKEPVQKWFPFAMPAPKVNGDAVSKAIIRYEKRRDAAFAEALPSSLDELKRAFVWLGGKPYVQLSVEAVVISWIYMGEYEDALIPYYLNTDVADIVKADGSIVFEEASSAKQARLALAEEAAALLWSLRPEARAIKADESAVRAATAEKEDASECLKKAVAYTADGAFSEDMLTVLQQARGVGLCRV